MIRVLIADDHVIFRQGLLKLLQTCEDVAVVGEVGDGREALRLIEKETPDIAILDISMPGITGFDIANEIQLRDIRTKIIFLTMHNDPPTAKKALQSSSGYVLKDDAFDDLLYAIRSVSSGKKFVSPSISEKILTTGTMRKNGDRILTDRECEILRLIASGLTNKKIAGRLSISVKTVETHRSRIMQKLDSHTSADLVRQALKMGLIELI
jgi:DNA-binding NarL/FixJ family response regulator